MQEIRNLIDRLSHIGSFYEHQTSGRITINDGIQTLIDSNRPTRQKDLAKFMETLEDMKRYSSDKEAVIFNEATGLLSQYVEQAKERN